MTSKVKRYMDAFTFALGGVSVASAYGALPIVANDRINAAWDEKLRAEQPPERSEFDPDCAGAGWAT